MRISYTTEFIKSKFRFIVLPRFVQDHGVTIKDIAGSDTRAAAVIVIMSGLTQKLG